MIKYMGILFLLAGYACNGSGNIKEPVNKDSYVFPHKSVIGELPADCVASEEDQLIELGSGLEDILLGAFSKPVTTADELKYGKKMAIAMREDMIFIEDSRTEKLRTMLNKMKPYLARKDIPYTISLVDDTLVNAFTHAGGNIYVTTGLLKFVETDDELAFVIAHEIGHNENEHCRKSVQRLMTATAIMGDEDIGGIANSLLRAVFAPFDQHQELDADLSGVYLAFAAGYDPKRSEDFFRKLAKNEEENIIDKFLRSHPWSAERQSCVNSYLNNARQ
jgi:beta-barrel assembly-enhancing protease